MSTVERIDRLVCRPGAADVQNTRLLCTQCYRCYRDVKSVLRCDGCGASCPTSKIGAAIVRPPAFVFYVFALVVVAIFSFA
jgi:hypothetical protein